MTEVMYVQVENNTVTNSAMINDDDVPEWATNIKGWVLADDTVEIGHVYDGSVFSAPDATSLTAAEKSARVESIVAEYVREGSALKYLTDMVYEMQKSQNRSLTRAKFDAILQSKVESG